MRAVSTFSISTLFNQRREELGLSCALLAKRANVSLRTVQRILSGREPNPGFLTILTLAEILGLTIRFDHSSAQEIRQRQAERKADQVIALVQGTSALEAQAVTPQALRGLRRKCVHELLSGSNRKLWAD